jgi:hypothetical protein
MNSSNASSGGLSGGLTKKKPQSVKTEASSIFHRFASCYTGGEGGIRTLGTLQYA